MEAVVHMFYDAPIWLKAIASLLLFVIVNTIYASWTSQLPVPNIPVISLSEKGLNPAQSWSKAANELIAKGVRVSNGRPFQVISSTGPRIVVTTDALINEVRSHPNSDFFNSVSRDFFVGWSGFDGFIANSDPRGAVLPELLKQNLNTISSQVLNMISEECSTALEDNIGHSKDWHSVLIKTTIVDTIARVNARILVGFPLCRNPSWIQLAKDYTTHAFVGAYVLRMVPALVRPIAHWLLPTSYSLRRTLKAAHKLIRPEVERRRNAARQWHSASDKTKTKDPEWVSIEWSDKITRNWNVNIDHTAMQLSLTMASVHTTSSALSFAILDLVRRSELIEILRQEVVRVLAKGKWTMPLLNELRLMDSFLKESQRFHSESASLHRMFKKDTTLSDGSFLPAGTRVMAADRARDASVFEDPDTFNAYRFFDARKDNMDKTGNPNNLQYPSISPYILAFGYGKHACPGRFLASAELKVILSHILLKYDLELETSSEECEIAFELVRIVKDTVRLRMRRREEEIQLSN